MSETVFPAWLTSNMTEPLLSASDRLIEIMRVPDWSSPHSPDTRRAWTDEQELVNEVIDLVLVLKELPPPPIFLAHHRQLTRVALEFADASVLFLSALITETLSAAHHRAAYAQNTLDTAGNRAARSTALMNKVLENFRHGENLLKVANEAFVSGRLDREFLLLVMPEFKAIGISDPGILRPLAPLGLTVAAMHDRDRRERRVTAASQLLASVSIANAGWMDDQGFDLLKTTFRRAWSELRQQHERFAAELSQLNNGNWLAIHSMLDIASKLIEGPFSRLGSLLIVAESVSSGSENLVDEASLKRLAKSPIVSGQLRLAAPILTDGVEMLTRNAEAHYDYEPGPNVVAIRHEHGGHQFTDTLSGDDLVVQVMNLLEVSLAMAGSIVLWGWKLPKAEQREGIRRAWLADSPMTG